MENCLNDGLAAPSSLHPPPPPVKRFHSLSPSFRLRFVLRGIVKITGTEVAGLERRRLAEGISPLYPTTVRNSRLVAFSRFLFFFFPPFLFPEPATPIVSPGICTNVPPWTRGRRPACSTCRRTISFSRDTARRRRASR